MKSEVKSANKDRQTLIISKYKQYLRLEKSLSANTYDAYLSDLDKLLHFTESEQIGIDDITLDDLQRFAAGLHDIGIHPRSQARIISGIRSFFHFLALSDFRKDDPSELLEGPKIGFKLPEVLSVEEIDAIIGAIDLSKDEGQRNRAILETLYSCGLRVSELCNLKLSDLYFKEGFIKVEGKGDKQRLVPISSRAIKEIENWFIDRNTRWKIKRILKIMSFWRDGEKHITYHDFSSDQRAGRESRYHQKHQSAHLSAFVCDSSAGRRSKLARHPMHVGARVNRNNRNLHSYRPQYAKK